MATPYPDWLKSLGSRRADLTGQNGAVRGQYIEHTITYPGDVSTASLAMAVKAAPDSLDELLTFTIGPPVFADGKTTWTASVAEGWTIAADTDADGIELFLYDVLITQSGANAERIFGGLFEVSGFITEPA